MNSIKHQKSLGFHSWTTYVILWTALLFSGALSFCNAQTTNEFQVALDSAGTSKSAKKSKTYYLALRRLQKSYQVHLDTNCEDKAALYRNLGIHFYNNKDKGAALRYIQDTALSIALNCQNISDELLTQIYINILNSKLVLNQLQDLPPFIEKLKWHIDADRAGPISHQAKIQSHISRYYDELGDHDKAVLWIKNSIANHNKLPLSEKKLRAFLEWAYILYGMEQYTRAITIFDSTKILSERLNLHHVSKYNADLIYNQAVCYEELKNYSRALELTQTYASMTDENDIIIQSDIANLKAHIAFNKHDHSTAIDYMRQSVQLSIESNDEYQQLDLEEDFLFLSEAYLQRNEPHLAAEQALLAINKTIIRPINSHHFNIDFSKLLIKNPNGFNRAAFQLFKALTKLYSFQEVCSFADQLDINFFNLLTKFSGDESTFEVTRRHHEFCDVFLEYIFSKNLENQYSDLTSYYIATSKSLALLKQLSLEQNIPASSKPEFDSLQRHRHAIFSQLETQESLGHIKKVDSLIELYFHLAMKQEQFNQRIGQLNHTLNFRKFRKTLIEQTQSKLTNTEAVIDFFYGEKYIYACRIEKGRVRFFRQPIVSTLKEDFVSIFSSTQAKHLNKYNETIDSISKYFEPIITNQNADIKKLTFIPDGRLLYLPFEALHIESKLLIERASIHYLFSSSVQELQQNRPAHVTRSNYAGFAMSYSDDLLTDISQCQDITSIYKSTMHLGRLPYAVEEVKISSKIFSGTNYLNESCTRETFFKEAGQCQILHIANHALLQEENSNLSAIIFSKNKKADLINAVDIKKLNLSADLAILSSCNSGQGELVAGNGLRSLGLSFVESGCPAILVNLWEASDKSTMQLIASFSQNLFDGMTKSKALRQAKLEYLKSARRELQHPKYWAHMILIGNDEALSFPSQSSSLWKRYGAIGILIICCCIGFYFFRVHIKN